MNELNGMVLKHKFLQARCSASHPTNRGKSLKALVFIC